ncbi:29646_t:CDS:2, partial [Racocetra persica]
QSVELNYAKAIYKPSQCYEYGHGTRKEESKAFEQYQKAANLGHKFVVIIHVMNLALEQMFSILRDKKSSVSSTSNSLSQTASPCPISADEEAFLECIEVIESNLGDTNIINKASDKEKKWWTDGNYKVIDEKRLPLCLVENVTYHDYEKKSEIANAGRFWEFDDGVVIIYELPNRDHEAAHGEFTFQFMSAFNNLLFQDRVSSIGATTCLNSGRSSAKQPDASFVPNCLPRPSLYPSDAQCYKFCRRANLQVNETQGKFRPVQTLEFGTIDKFKRPYNGCSALRMCTVTIAPACVYKGCTPPYLLTGNVIIDLFSIQQAVFSCQGQ